MAWHDPIDDSWIHKAIAAFNRGERDPRFKASKKYDLLYEGGRYPPKQIVALAYRMATGSPVSNQLSGGEDKGQANAILRNYGFEVVLKDWTADEVNVVVEDYFSMLQHDLLGKTYNKAAHNRRLRAGIARSGGSVEFKHQNISAVLVKNGYPYISGYKPRFNYQSALADAVQQFIDDHPDFFTDLADATKLQRDKPSAFPSTALSVFDTPPDQLVTVQSYSKPWLSRKGRKIDFVLRDAQRRKVGRAGEEWTVQVEQMRLKEAGRDDLAGKVEWISDTRGDGLGFDILSFDPKDDSELLIEVKTTNQGKYFPFYLTDNEVRCSEDVPEQFRLYRVFEFGAATRAFVLEGALSTTCEMSPVNFRATPKVG